MLIDEEEEPIQEYTFAAPGKRLFIALIELVNCWILAYLVGFVLPHVYKRPLYLGCVVLLLAYKIISEKSSGQSFSKKMYALLVLTDDMQKTSWAHVFKRNIFWIILPVLYATYFYILVPVFGEDYLQYPVLFSLVNLGDIFKIAVLIAAIDMAFVFMTPKRQALHDIIGGTVVIDRN
ncbi:MAG: RDD family protein [Cytophaga sp.]|uniref:RDD family protein n=1 Tax=Cytophaga sp. TaxID=29535 RepID=UPI003F7F1389